MKDAKNRIAEIRRMGINAKGRLELIRHLEGGKNTPASAIRAKCYECMGYYADGKKDCKVPTCPLYPFMPYREDK